ncbi:hypothetical protein MNBD_NITROSPINAE01-207, partial [hydrothermal vent metagenome]
MQFSVVKTVTFFCLFTLAGAHAGFAQQHGAELLRAVMAGDVSTVKTLIAQGADPNVLN